jgi:hypothetical protein
MKQVIDIEAIKGRHAEIAREIEALRAEQDELDTVLRVARRFGPVDSLPDETSEAGGAKLGPKRPEGVPSLFEMTVSVIKEAMAAGKPGLRGGEIVDAIGSKFWPGVQRPQVLPPVYQFAKKGRLKKSSEGIFSV